MIEKTIAAIRETEASGIADGSFGRVLSGFSGEKVIGVLQRLVAVRQDQGTCYLEVGVFQGLTLLATAHANRSTPCYGIDNFAFFDRDGQNAQIVADRTSALSLSNAHIVNDDYENAFSNLSARIGDQKIGVYFIDGPHDYRSQLMCLLLALKWLAPCAAIVIDDCNYAHVRQANCDFLHAHPDFKLAFEAYTPSHPINMTKEVEAAARKGWWNGVNIIVHDPEDRIERNFPPTDPDREQYLQEHIVHSLRGARLATHAVMAAQAIYTPLQLPAASARLIREIWRQHGRMCARFNTANTDSASLLATRTAAFKN